jgi:hypothetical protein
MTNAKGVYSHSLAEFTLTCCSFFAKDFPRLLRQKADANWAPYDVEELRGKTLGVVGYGASLAGRGGLWCVAGWAWRRLVRAGAAPAGSGCLPDSCLSRAARAQADHPPSQLQVILGRHARAWRGRSA